LKLIYYEEERENVFYPIFKVLWERNYT